MSYDTTMADARRIFMSLSGGIFIGAALFDALPEAAAWALTL